MNNNNMSSKISPQKFYDEFASTYDATCKEAKINVQHVNEAARIFHKYHRDRQGTLLDVGCGTGLLKDLLEGKLQYTGIDISQNMLNYASARGYKTIHKPIEVALQDISDDCYDFIFALGSLLFVKDIYAILAHFERIARKSILLSLDNLTEEYINNFVVPAYNHAGISIPNAKEDYLIKGWTSPTTGITIQTRMVYIEKN